MPFLDRTVSRRSGPIGEVDDAVLNVFDSLRDGLVDELRLMVHPVILGNGRRLFENGTGQTPLELVVVGGRQGSAAMAHPGQNCERVRPTDRASRQ